MAYLESQNETYKQTSYEAIAKYDRVGFMMGVMKKTLETTESFLDIGCAKGEIIAAFKSKWPEIAYTGVDASDELIELAQSYPPLNGVKFSCGKVEDLNLGSEFDVVLMSGLLSCFDDINLPLKAFMEHLREGGKGYIFGIFNDEDVDTLISFKACGGNAWQSGLNLFSCKTMECALEGKTDQLKWHQFSITTDLDRERGNITKSYTIRTEDGDRLILNGIGLVQSFYMLEFTKKTN